MATRNQQDERRSHRGEERSPGQREPASDNRRQSTSSREMQRAAVRRQAFNRMEEGDEGTSEWESSARDTNY